MKYDPDANMKFIDTEPDYGFYVDRGCEWLRDFMVEVILALLMIVVARPLVVICKIFLFPLWCIGKLVYQHEEKHET